MQRVTTGLGIGLAILLTGVDPARADNTSVALADRVTIEKLKDGEAGDIGAYRRYSRTQSSRKTSRSKPDRILRQTSGGGTSGSDQAQQSAIQLESKARSLAANEARRTTELCAADSGVLVYRRVRVGECFAGSCRDTEYSLALQLGALQKSMAYEADIPNFLEPWYGIGVLAAAYGVHYIWQGDAAPAMRPKYGSVDQVLDVNPTPIHQTEIGKHNLAMAETFMRKTGGRIPISLCDIQSPLNTVGHVMDSGAFFLGCYDAPDAVRELLNRMADLIVDYLRKFVGILGDALVMPGHGFASSRCLPGIGVSDDNIVMLSADIYRTVAAESIERMGDAFGGLAYHSCGCYADKLDVVKQLKGLTCIDAAFTIQTDPAPNRPEDFADALAGTGITLNARMVGDLPTVVETVKSLARPNLKVIVVTYCADKQEQGNVYDAVHEILR